MHRYLEIEKELAQMNRWRHPLIIKWFGGVLFEVNVRLKLSEVNMHSHALSSTDKKTLKGSN